MGCCGVCVCDDYWDGIWNHPSSNDDGWCAVVRVVGWDNIIRYRVTQVGGIVV